MASTASAIDPFMLENHGFSLSDLLEVALRYSHGRLGQLSPAWPTERLARDKPPPDNEVLDKRIERIAATPVALRREEVDAAQALGGSYEKSVSLCVHPDRAAAAWKWATATSDELDVELEPMAGGLGIALAVESEGHLRLVPASLILSALAAATGVLAAEAAADAASVRALQVTTVQRAVSILGISQQLPQYDPLDRVDQPDTASISLPGVGLVTVALPARRHAFAIGVVSGLDRDGLVTATDDAQSMLSGITVDHLIEAGADIDATAVVRRVVICGGPLRKSPSEKPGVAHLHVEELASMMLDVQRSELGQDLIYQFYDELATMPGITQLSAADFLDIWRYWNISGVLNPSGETGIPLQLAWLPDDSAWVTAAAWEPVECVLTAASLPPVSDWYGARLDDRGHATLYTEDTSHLVFPDPPLIISTLVYGG